MKTLTCIVCPIGCRITAELREGQYVFSGNRCPKGTDFARAELTAPMRMVTTTVRTAFPEAPALPVKTNGEVPKALIPAILRILAGVCIHERMGIGETVYPDIASSGCDVIATSDVLKSSTEKGEKPCPTHSYSR